MRLADKFINASIIEEREKAGVTLSYIAGHRIIQNLNEVYPDKWKFELVRFEEIYKKEIVNEKKGKTGYEVGVFCCGKLTINGAEPITMEDVGYGLGTDYNNMLYAHESAGKEAVTDCLKRCAKNLGNYFALALYDKEQEAVLTCDANGWNKLLKLSNRYCNLETSSEMNKAKDVIKAKYKITLPDQMKEFMWKEILEACWVIYWDSFTQQPSKEIA